MAKAGPNLARAARVSAPDASEAGPPAALLTDGKADVNDNAGRWLYRGPLPHAAEFTWNEPVSIGAARIVSGYFDGAVSAPIADFVLQWHDGTAWKDISGTAVTGNRDPYWNRTFPPVKATKIRLWITATQIDVSRIWEVEFYRTVTDP
jgi:hypothetical protein